MPTALVIHGHFYQPPRDNPWTQTVEREPSAHPAHDWNERVFSECYRPNAFARVFDDRNRIESIVNNYSHMSFNFGPTLLGWIERLHPLTYARILAADHESQTKRGGHGNAVAQAYNHTILPLCNERDRATQVQWGISDFRYRFRREPEGMWLPETACNDETLSSLIEHGIKFTILSPYQALRVRSIAGSEWKEVRHGTIDPGVPYRYFHRDGSRRHIDLFFYNAACSRAVAFEGALHSSHVLVDHFARAIGGTGRLISAATDGESYGHHTGFGDRCLAYTLRTAAPKAGFWVTNYGEFLERHPPTLEVEIDKGPDGLGTAWSCAHGVGRWFRDCGCNLGAQEGWNQAWRTPLRKGLDALRDQAAGHFEVMGSDLFADPWAARNAYVDLFLDRSASRDVFFETHARRKLSEQDRVRALTLLEMQRSSMLMYTSCGWFFSDISGIETIQILKYAGRVIDFIDELGLTSPRDSVLEILSTAKSNKSEIGTAADVYRRFVEPLRVLPQAVVAHVGITSLLDGEHRVGEVAGCTYRGHHLERQQLGRLTLCTGEIQVENALTRRTFDGAFAAMHLGGLDFFCVVKPFPGRESFLQSTRKLWEKFPTGSVLTILRLAEEEFGPEEYGLEHLLPEGRKQISERIFGAMVHRFTEQYALIYEDHRRAMDMLQSMGFELPRELQAAAEFTLGRRFAEEIRRQQQSRDPAAYQSAVQIAAEVGRCGYQIDRTDASRTFGNMIIDAVRMSVTDPAPRRLQSAIALIELAKELDLSIDLDRAQEALHSRETLSASPANVEDLRKLANLLGLSPKVIGKPP